MNRDVIVSDFLKSRSSKDMLYHLQCDKHIVTCENDGLGKYHLKISYYRGNNHFLTFVMIFDGRNYEHQFGIVKNGEVEYFNYHFLVSASDYFYAYLYKYGLMVAKCKTCTHCTISNKIGYSQNYICDVGQVLSLERIKENCLLYQRRGSRLPKLSKPYLVATNLFGKDIVTIGD